MSYFMFVNVCGRVKLKSNCWCIHTSLRGVFAQKIVLKARLRLLVDRLNYFSAIHFSNRGSMV